MAKIEKAAVDVAKLVAKITRQGRRIEKLEASLAACWDVLAFIRYKSWPTPGLGIGLQAYVMDEAMIPAEQLLPARSKAKPKNK